MESTVRNVRSYTKKKVIQVPETADSEYMTHFLPSSPNSLLLSSQDQCRICHLLCSFHLCSAFRSMSLFTWVDLWANCKWYNLYRIENSVFCTSPLENPILEELFMWRLSCGFYIRKNLWCLNHQKKVTYSMLAAGCQCQRLPSNVSHSFFLRDKNKTEKL